MTDVLDLHLASPAERAEAFRNFHDVLGSGTRRRGARARASREPEVQQRAVVRRLPAGARGDSLRLLCDATVHRRPDRAGLRARRSPHPGRGSGPRICAAVAGLCRTGAARRRTDGQRALFGHRSVVLRAARLRALLLSARMGGPAKCRLVRCRGGKAYAVRSRPRIARNGRTV